jgi:hypothetical protein
MKTKKALMGRPPLGKDAKTIPLMVKVSQKELVAFRKAAKAEGMALGPWLIQHRRADLEGGK